VLPTAACRRGRGVLCDRQTERQSVVSKSECSTIELNEPDTLLTELFVEFPRRCNEVAVVQYCFVTNVTAESELYSRSLISEY